MPINILLNTYYLNFTKPLNWNIMLKPVNVHMLPTDRASLGEILLALGTTSYCIEGELYINRNPTFDKESTQYGGTFYQPQHLYFTTDEEIVTGKWYINKQGHIVCAVSTDTIEDRKDGKRILACTDKQWVEQVNSHLTRTLEIIPSSFITVYILAYNAGNPITQVMLKGDYYHCYKKRWLSFPKAN